MSELDTSSAARTPRDLEESKLNARYSELVKEDAENPDPNKPFRTREKIIADFLNTAEGARMYAAVQNASTTPIRKLMDLPVSGPMAPIIDLMIKDGGKTIRKSDPALSEAEAVSRFLKTADGRLLYGIGASLPAGATFEGNPKAVRYALGLVRTQVIEKGASFSTTPLTMKFSALLAAVARKST